MTALLLMAAILSDSFETERFDEFMRLPTWMQGMSVAAKDTFGTQEHARSSRRITKNSIAAVITAPAAYYERSYYVSEGASNVWNTSEVGPLEPSPDSFTYGFGAGPFYAAHGREDPALTVTNTLRFVEYDNIRRVYEDGISSLIDNREDGRLPLARPSWDSGVRRVFWSSTFMPDEVLANSMIPWSGPDRFGEAQAARWFIPLAALMITPEDGALHEYGFHPHDGYDMVSRQFLKGITFGSTATLDTDIGKMTPVAGYDDVVTNSLAGLLSARFGSSPESVYNERGTYETRRLMPDEYMHVDVSWQREYIDSFNVTLYDEPWEPWNELPKGYLYENFYGREGLYTDYFRAEFSAPFSRGEIRAEYPVGDYYEPAVSRTFDFALTDVPEGADTVVFEGDSWMSVIDVESSNGWASADGTYIAAAEWGGGWEPDEVTLDAYKTVLVTNSVTRLVSNIAAASRAAAMMDKTHEIVQTKGGMNLATRYSVQGSGSMTNDPMVARVETEVIIEDPYPGENKIVFRYKSFGEDKKYSIPCHVERPMSLSVSTHSEPCSAERDYLSFEGSYLNLDSFELLVGENDWLQAIGELDCTFHKTGKPDDIFNRLPFGRSRVKVSSVKIGFSIYGEFEVATTSPLPVKWRSTNDVINLETIVDRMTNEWYLTTCVRANVSGSYDLGLSRPLASPVTDNLYAFAGPSASCFSTMRVGSAHSFSAAGVIAEFVKSGYGYDRSRQSWPSIGSPEELTERNYDGFDIYSQSREYSTFGRKKFNSAFEWKSQALEARAAARNKILEMFTATTGGDATDPSSIIYVMNGMLTGGDVDGVKVDSFDATTKFHSEPDLGEYWIDNDGQTAKIYEDEKLEHPIDHFLWTFTVGGAEILKPVGSLPMGSRHEVRREYEKPPFAANGKTATAITTEWKWKALGIKD